jgi:hypothetical protein
LSYSEKEIRMNLGPLFSLFLLQASNGAIEVNAVVCRDASQSALISSLAFDVVAVGIALALKGVWDRRLLWSQGVRFGVSLVSAIVLSSILVAWNPLRDEIYEACIESAQFSRYVFMSHVAAVPRGLVLGGAISAALFLLIVVVLGLLSKRKNR